MSKTRPGTEHVYRQSAAEMEQLRLEQEAQKLAQREARMATFRTCFKKNILNQIARIQEQDRLAAIAAKDVGEAYVQEYENEGYF